MIPERRLAQIRTLAAPAPGQFGPDHTVVEAIRPREWRQADPFVLLMDDRVDGRLLAGPHPHAGFETVTFAIEGSLPAEHGKEAALEPGDVEWTTAGSGIVHGPDQPLEGRMRVLQLWLTLPKAERWTEPDHQFIRRTDALVRREPGVEAHLYSGSSGDLVSPTRNRVPVTLVDVRLEPGGELVQRLPASYNGFLYVLEGGVSVGASEQELGPGQIGWLDADTTSGETSLRLRHRTGEPARVLLYAGERQNTPIAWYGPFIGDTQADLVRSFERYRAGEFVRI